MSFRTRRVLTMTPLWMILEFFLLKYIFLLYGGLNDYITLGITVVLGLIQVLPMFFEERHSTRTGRFLSTLFGVWEWYVVMFLILTVALYIAGVFVSIPRNIISLCFAAVVLIGFYAYYNAHHIHVNSKTLELDKLSREIKIIHVSDVHFGSVRHHRILEDLKNKINTFDDVGLVLVSGDIADGSCVVEEDDFLPLKDVDVPVIFTSGNHDYYPGIENVHRALERAGVVILENDRKVFDELNIYGLSYSFSPIETVSDEELASSTDADKVNIILFHVPYRFEEFIHLGYDVQLSGHTHGGQFYPIIWFGNHMFKYNKGLFETSYNGRNRYINVSVGLGSMDVPMRWGTHSDIDLLTLKPKR